MATYEELIETVRDWANRDESVLPDTVIQKSLQYTADEAYRLLEIPALEYTKSFVACECGQDIYYVYPNGEGNYVFVQPYDISKATLDSNDVNPDVANATISVPSDTVSFIYLRTPGYATHPEVGSYCGETLITDNNRKSYVVVSDNGHPKIINHTFHTDTMFNEKTNIRSFYDFNDTEIYKNYYARKEGNLILAGELEPLEVYELFYYRRLPALDARVNIPAGLTLADATSNTSLYEVLTQEEYNALSSLNKNTYEKVETGYVRSTKVVDNWLRDENERVLLFGALHRVFDYLQEDQQSIKYKERFLNSVAELNAEEKKRKLSAGQAYTRFNANGLI